jgi:hypothetical protein
MSFQRARQKCLDSNFNSGLKTDSHDGPVSGGPVQPDSACANGRRDRAQCRPEEIDKAATHGALISSSATNWRSCSIPNEGKCLPPNVSLS